ncbi:DsbA family protein [Candidatus Wolfebacteria bacterium]|nr:DsbA family protein [Candidatus Wolfebacteria bacterium]
MDSKLLIPGAIVLAGVIVAGALVLNRSGNLGTDGSSSNTPEKTDIQIEAVSADDHILGNPNAQVIVVEYSDLECPFCKSFHDTTHRIIDDYGPSGEVAWVYRHFPLAQLHPKAPKEAEATECANELGGNDAFWAYTDRVFELTPSNNGLDLALLPQIAEDIGLDQAAFDACLTSGKYASEVEKDFNAAVTAGGTGTPFTVLLLDEPLSAAAENVVGGIASQFNSRNPNTIVVSKDKKKVAIGGALPFEGVLKPIIDAALF